MKHIILICYAIGCIFSTSPMASATIYRWVDENGVKHFSEFGPPDIAEDSNSEKSSLAQKKSPTQTGQNQKIDSLEAVRQLSYLGTPDSLKSIQSAALPAAYEGNKIAIHICRQTMYGLDDDVGLDGLQLKSAISVSKETTAAWAKLVAEKAEAGDPFFKSVLAVLYMHGDGVAKDNPTALRLWEESAAAGYTDAYVKLAHVYHKGLLGTAINYEKSMAYYLQAAEKGSATALYFIGVLYYKGKGVPKQPAVAFSNWQKAADLGYTMAQYDVGLCYLRGDGVAKDRDQGLEWMKKSANAGNSKAMNKLSRMGIKSSVASRKKAETVTSLNANAATTATRDKPRNFRNVQIPASAARGIFQNIRNCDLEGLDQRLQANADLFNSQNPSGWTPLTMAIASGCKHITAYLIDQGVDVNEPHQKYNFTPLHIASLTGQKDSVRLLIDRGADMNVVCNPPSQQYWYGRMVGTPLHTALFNRKYAILEFLLENGADPNIRDGEGRTLFEFAAIYSKRERVSEIYSRLGLVVPNISASVEELMNAIGDCDVTSTREKGQKQVNEILGSAPGLIHKKDKHGNTPLHRAAFHHLEDIIMRLVEMGADVNAKNNRGETPLHKISHDQDIARFLIQNGARVNEQNNNGQTPLHVIAGYPGEKSGIKVARILLANGASTGIQDVSGKTPIEIAQQKGLSQMEELLQKGI